MVGQFAMLFLTIVLRNYYATQNGNDSENDRRVLNRRQSETSSGSCFLIATSRSTFREGRFVSNISDVKVLASTVVDECARFRNAAKLKRRFIASATKAV